MQLWEIEKERYQEGKAEGKIEGRAEMIPFLIEMSIKMTGNEEISINEVANTVPNLTIDEIKSVWYEYKEYKNKD